MSIFDEDPTKPVETMRDQYVTIQVKWGDNPSIADHDVTRTLRFPPNANVGMLVGNMLGLAEQYQEAMQERFKASLPAAHYPREPDDGTHD